MENETKSQEQGGPTRPFHIVTETWNEKTSKLEDYIRDNKAFEGKFQSRVDGSKLFIPDEMKPLIESGGVVSVSTENHLLIFGHTHWQRYQRILSKEVGLSPVHNEVSRHVYGNMYRFSKLTDDGAIILPRELIQYAGLKDDLVIIGLIYHAEVHEKKTYLNLESEDNKISRLERFKKIIFK